MDPLDRRCPGWNRNTLRPKDRQLGVGQDLSTGAIPIKPPLLGSDLPLGRLRLGDEDLKTEDQSLLSLSPQRSM